MASRHQPDDEPAFVTLPPKLPAPAQPRTELSPILFWLLVSVALALGYAVITRLAVGIGDEDVHRFQIDWFLHGRYEQFEHVTVLPLYHLVVAALAQFSGHGAHPAPAKAHHGGGAGRLPARPGLPDALANVSGAALRHVADDEHAGYRRAGQVQLLTFAGRRDEL